jgi:tetratricopeptide (TPR) repeat protein
MVVGARSDRRIFPITLSILLLIATAGGGVLFWQYVSQRSDAPQRADTPQRADLPRRPDTPRRPDLVQRAAYTEVYSMLGISPLPEAVETSVSIRRPLEQLSRERCDQQAIFDLGRALQNAGYRREAAKADVSFSGTCGGYAPSLRRAANVLLELTDYRGAEKVASELINLEPLFDNGYYLRGLARDGSGLAEQALDDYVTTIELVGDKDRIISTPYFNMARLYEKLGRFCDAVLPIEAWVSLNPKLRHEPNPNYYCHLYNERPMRYRYKGQCRSFCGPTVEQRGQFACDYQRHSGNACFRHRRDVRFSKEQFRSEGWRGN